MVLMRNPSSDLDDDLGIDLVEAPTVPLTRDLRQGAALLSRFEIRWLVDYYYQQQEYRKRAENIIKRSENEPNALTGWVMDNTMLGEAAISSALKTWTKTSIPGQWAMSQHGIGHILTAGLLAHIDIEKAPTVGHIWRFAGLDPSVTWNKETKRPWNARLKVLVWKIGQSFVKFHNSPKCVYGHIYAERKALEIKRNEAGAFREQAERALRDKKYRTDTDTRKAYEAGKLPDGRIELRAERYATKIFLAHFHWVAYETHYGKEPPNPYVIEHLGHVDLMRPPNWPMQ